MTLNVNGQDYNVSLSNPDMPLLWVLRDIIGLTGTKYGCGIEVCGACTVLIDDQPEHACVFNASSAVGKKVVTIEGLSPTTSHPAQQAWIQNQVPQCGYCQSGVIMAVAGAMKAGHHGAEIKSSVKNLCVCGTYNRMSAAMAKL